MIYDRGHHCTITAILLHCLLLGSLLTQVTCLRFIAAPLLAISPAMDIMGVAAQLHSRGHDVLVVVTESALGFAKAAAARSSSNTTAEALEYLLVDVHFQEFSKPKPLKLGEVPKPSMFAIPDSWPQSLLTRMTAGVAMLQLFQPGVAIMAQQLLANTTLMQRLRDFRADAWMSVGLSVGSVVKDNTGCIMAHALGVHLVDVSGNTFFEGPPTAPQFGSLVTPADLQTLPGMALNLATWAVYQATPATTDILSPLRPSHTDKLRQQFGLPWAASPCWLCEGFRRLCGIQTRRCRAVVEVMMGTWLVEYPRTLPANKVLVGPGTAHPAGALSPPDVAEFVSSAAHGVVLAAFGTVYGPTLRPEDVQGLAEGFAALAPVRVLWALKPSALRSGIDIDDLPLGPNTLVVPWVDYNDVLGHPHTRAIVSHCGLHSVNEAAFHGVPLVGIPFQMEQAEHALKLVTRGAAVISHQAPAFRRGSPAAQAMTFTADHVAGLIREVLSNSSYAQAADAIGSALQRYAAQRHPYERAADEVELAVLAAGAREGQTERDGKAAAVATASSGTPGVGTATAAQVAATVGHSDEL